jgi:hypothetical protein
MRGKRRKAEPEKAGGVMPHCSAIECGAQISKEMGTAKKRRPPCRHGGLESREETPKEGICGRSCRTATISVLTAAVASLFFIRWAVAHLIRGTVAFRSGPERGDAKANNVVLSMI